LFGWKLWRDQSDIPRCGPKVPNLFGTHTLSICLQCDFVDQCYAGNLKGQIFIVSDRGEPYHPEKGFQNRRVLARSLGVQHHSMQVKLTLFNPRVTERIIYGTTRLVMAVGMLCMCQTQNRSMLSTAMTTKVSNVPHHFWIWLDSGVSRRRCMPAMCFAKPWLLPSQNRCTMRSRMGVKNQIPF
jgi:hypothetical protein